MMKDYTKIDEIQTKLYEQVSGLNEVKDKPPQLPIPTFVEVIEQVGLIMSDLGKDSQPSPIRIQQTMKLVQGSFKFVSSFDAVLRLYGASASAVPSAHHVSFLEPVKEMLEATLLLAHELGLSVTNLHE